MDSKQAQVQLVAGPWANRVALKEVSEAFEVGRKATKDPHPATKDWVAENREAMGPKETGARD